MITEDQINSNISLAEYNYALLVSAAGDKMAGGCEDVDGSQINCLGNLLEAMYIQVGLGDYTSQLTIGLYNKMMDAMIGLGLDNPNTDPNFQYPQETVIFIVGPADSDTFVKKTGNPQTISSLITFTQSPIIPDATDLFQPITLGQSQNLGYIKNQYDDLQDADFRIAGTGAASMFFAGDPESDSYAYLSQTGINWSINDGQAHIYLGASSFNISSSKDIILNGATLQAFNAPTVPNSLIRLVDLPTLTIQNQSSISQSSANFWISGSGKVDNSLFVGTSSASNVTVNDDNTGSQTYMTPFYFMVGNSQTVMQNDGFRAHGTVVSLFNSNLINWGTRYQLDTSVGGINSITGTQPVVYSTVLRAANAPASATDVVRLSDISGFGGGTVTSVTSANSDIGVATGTTTPVLTFNRAVSGLSNYYDKTTGDARYATNSYIPITRINDLLSSFKTYDAFGDSITFGLESSIQNNSYVSLIGHTLGLTFTNHGVSGDQAADEFSKIYAFTPTATDSQLITNAIGTNDAFIYITDPDKQANFKAFQMAGVAYLSIPNTSKFLGTGTDITYTGTWSNSTINTPATITKVSATNGSTASFSLYGTVLYIAYDLQDGNGGTFSVTVDGALYGNYTAQGQNASLIATNNGINHGSALLRIPNLTPSLHTVVITVTSATSSSNNVWIDWVASNYQINTVTSPCVFVGTVLRQGGTAAWNLDVVTQAYSKFITDNNNLLIGDGLKITTVPISNYLNNTTDLYTDHVHPIDVGHAKLAAAYLNYINGPARTLLKEFIVTENPSIIGIGTSSTPGSYRINIDSSGNVTIPFGSTTIGNGFFIQTTGQTTSSRDIFGGATSVSTGIVLGNSNSQTLPVNDSYARTIFRASPIVFPATGSPQWGTNVTINTPSLTTLGSQLNNAATLYVNAAPTIANNNYGIYSVGNIKAAYFQSTLFTSGALSKFDSSGNIVAAISGTDYAPATGGSGYVQLSPSAGQSGYLHLTQASFFDSNVTITGNLNAISANASLPGLFLSTSAGSVTSTNQIYGSQSSVTVRAIYGNNNTFTQAVNDGYAAHMFQKSPIVLGNTGTTVWASAMVVKQTNITSNGSALTNNVTLYLEAPNSLGTNKYSLYSEGSGYFGQQVTIGNNALQILGANPTTDPSLFQTSLGIKIGASGNLTHRYTNYADKHIFYDDGTNLFDYALPFGQASGILALVSQIPTNANYVDLTTNQSVAGNKTWTGAAQNFNGTIVSNNNNISFNSVGGANSTISFTETTSGFFTGLTRASTLTQNSSIFLQDGSGILAFTSQVSFHGNSTTTGTATTRVTVSIGRTMPNTGYYVSITPKDLLTAINFYVDPATTTTTTFDVVFATAITGSINFDWNLTP